MTLDVDLQIYTYTNRDENIDSYTKRDVNIDSYTKRDDDYTDKDFIESVVKKTKRFHMGGFKSSVKILKLIYYVKNRGLNSFRAKGNIEVFANNTDSGESACNELSHLKSALFAFYLSK